MKNPKISIIIPTYNAQNDIARCINSCISQSCNEIEIIIIDDCGNDKSIQIAQKYAQKDARITIYTNPKNLGTFQSRIQGAKIAKGEYICFLDADDFLEKKTCEVLYKKAQKHGADIVFFGMKFFPPKLTKIPPKSIISPLKDGDILKEVFLNSSTPPWSIWGKLYKKELVDESIKILDFVNEHLVMAEDLLQSFVLIALAKNSIGTKERFYIYCESSSSIMRDTKTRDKKISNLKRIIELFDALEESSLISNPYFMKSKIRVKAILKATIELEYRFDKSPTLAYLKACLKSLKYHQRWQTYIRILGFIFSFGKIKL